jgi:hypothetical protein
MHGQPIADPADADGTYDSTILDLLVIEHDGLWSIDELKRMLGDDTQVDDSLARLHGLGLVHRLDGYVCATRGAAHIHLLPS